MSDKKCIVSDHSSPAANCGGAENNIVGNNVSKLTSNCMYSVKDRRIVSTAIHNITTSYLKYAGVFPVCPVLLATAALWLYDFKLDIRVARVTL